MTLVLGIGLRPGTAYEELRALVTTVIDGTEDVAVVVTLDRRAGDPVVGRLARELGAELRSYPADELAAQPVPTPSETVAAATGTASVAEAAVLATGAVLIAGKRTSTRASAALGRLRPRSEPALNRL
jgi:cobalamin biosynthesis protein CbiG